MKQLLKSFLALSLILSSVATSFAACSADCNTNSGNNSCNNSCNTNSGNCTNSSSNCCGPRSVFIPRSQGANTARELVGWQQFVHRFDVCEFYAVGDFIFEYERSFQDSKIANSLFGANVLNFVGSQVANRVSAVPSTTTAGCNTGCNTTCSTGCSNSCDTGCSTGCSTGCDTNSGCNGSCNIVADYFGLAIDSVNVLNVKPRIQNFIFDFNFYVGLDEWLEGLYFRANLPVTYTKWQLLNNCNTSCSNDCFSNNGCSNTCNTSCNTGCNTTCFSTTTSSSSTPFPPCYMSSTTATPTTSLQTALGGNFTFGDMQTAWQYGKFSFCEQKKTALADIDLILGWDFLKSECGHFGLYLQAVCPTGNRPNAKYVFQPIVGNGKHWELGGGISTHYSIWEDDCDQNLEFWLEGNITHMFKTCSTRSFDFCGKGPLSRYMLLKELSGPTPFTYEGSLINAINFATRTVETSFAVKGDFSLKLAYRNCGWAFDIGYNIYGRSKETGCIKNGCNVTDANLYGFKGIEGVCCREFALTGSTITAATGASSALNSTQSLVNGICAVTTPATADNAVSTVDFPGSTVCLAWNSATTGTILSPSVVVAQTSDPAVVVTTADLDVNSGLVCAEFTNKIFGYFGYAWTDCGDHNPFLGVGAEGEFAQNDSRRSGLSKWGVFVKGGLTF